jgi:filamentous hemagglutinin
VPLTRGFIDHFQALDHFSRHGSEFGAITFAQYVDLADNFLGSPRDAEILEGVRTDSSIVRYNPRTNEFGVITHDRIIKTYFIVNLDARARAKYPTNIDYFREQCRK